MSSLLGLLPTKHGDGPFHSSIPVYREKGNKKNPSMRSKEKKVVLR